jgi:hypothetical protein
MVSEPRIVYIDKLNAAVVIQFEDGTTVLYSSALLASIIPQAKDITDLPAGIGSETRLPRRRGAPTLVGTFADAHGCLASELKWTFASALGNV